MTQQQQQQSRVPVPVDALRFKALDRLIDAFGSAVNKARGTLLAANLIALVIFASLFNATFTWNKDQISRRCTLTSLAVSVASKLETEKDETKRDFHSALTSAIGELPDADAKWIRHVFDNSNNQDLSYFAQIRDARVLRDACERELLDLLDREERLDTIHLPFIGVEFASTDRTIIGALAMAIVAFWLIGGLATQSGTLASFLTRAKIDNVLEYSLAETFTAEESHYAYISINQTAAFSKSGSFMLSAIKVLLFTLPPLSIALSALYVICVGMYFELITLSRLLLEILVALTTLGLWLYAWIANRDTEVSVSQWGKRVHAAKPGPPPKD